MALAQVAPEPASPADDSNGSDSDVQSKLQPMPGKNNSFYMISVVAVEKPVMGFNQDLLCVHGKCEFFMDFLMMAEFVQMSFVAMRVVAE